jgi:hypothetical protein
VNCASAPKEDWLRLTGIVAARRRRRNSPVKLFTLRGDHPSDFTVASELEPALASEDYK